MRINKYMIGLVLLLLIFLSTNNLYAQKSISNEKKTLILEIYTLTGIQKYTVNQKLSSTDINEFFQSIINGEKDLTEAQKNSLKSMARKINDKITFETGMYLSNKSISSKIFEDVFIKMYDKEYTQAELQELINFYKTPTGKKSAKFMLSFNKKLVENYKKSMNKEFTDFLTPIVNNEADLLKQKISEMKKNK